VGEKEEKEDKSCGQGKMPKVRKRYFLLEIQTTYLIWNRA
jgi:hypothetical protein